MPKSCSARCRHAPVRGKRRTGPRESASLSKQGSALGSLWLAPVPDDRSRLHPPPPLLTTHCLPGSRPPRSPLSSIIPTLRALLSALLRLHTPTSTPTLSSCISMPAMAWQPAVGSQPAYTSVPARTTLVRPLVAVQEPPSSLRCRPPLTL